MNFLELSETRYSVRSYLPKSVPEDMLEFVLKSALMAPSAVNRQPWKFFVVCGEAMKCQLRQCYDREWFKTAPAYIVVCGDHSTSWKRPADGKDHCDIDVAIAAEHVALAAASLGLGTCWVCNFDTLSCRRILGLHDSCEPVVIIPIGYPAELPIPNKNRKDLSEIVSYL
mgnify:CR=1 FL=1